MPVTIRQVGPCFAGEVEGIDMRQKLTPDEVAVITVDPGERNVTCPPASIGATAGLEEVQTTEAAGRVAAVPLL